LKIVERQIYFIVIKWVGLEVIQNTRNSCFIFWRYCWNYEYFPAVLFLLDKGSLLLLYALP